MTGAKYLCQASRYHLLVVIGTMSRLLLVAEPRQHRPAWHGLEGVEAGREENVCGNWRFIKWQSSGGAYVLVESVYEVNVALGSAFFFPNVVRQMLLFFRL